MRVWRGAIVGFGEVALHGHLPAWRRQRDFRLVAVCDANPERRALAASVLPEARVYWTLDELLEQERLDFVDIATPPACHAVQVEAAARAGVHVLCEKPLTTSVAEFVHLQKCVRAAGVVLHTVHNWRFSEAFQAMRAAMSEERLGPVRHIAVKTIRQGCAPGAGGLWRLDHEVAGGGILVDHGWHTFYLLADLAGEVPEAVSAAVGRRRYTDVAVEDTAQCRVVFPSATAEIELTWAGAARQTSWAVQAEHGEVRVENGQLSVRGKRGLRRAELPSPAESSHHPHWFDGVIAEFRAALEHPELGRDNLSEAGLCVVLLQQAYRSAKAQGREFKVALPNV
ncbi:MAG: Gfo/Idh/MocA family oxidoreductase [Candidatus Binatia bacterium]|nr:Gfo/Idh/MocA family oxidoreductase [Candidatus Binatia bacterium]